MPMRRGFAFADVGLLVLASAVLAACASASPTPPEAGRGRLAVAGCGAHAGGRAPGQGRVLQPPGGPDHRAARPVLHGQHPAAVYVHGGSWVSGDYDTGGFIIDSIGPALAERGFVVVSLDYRLGPRGHWPDQIEDVKCAIRYLRANAHRLHIDPTEIGAWGQSAGGHLVALLGTAGPAAGWDVGPYRNESSAVQAVVDMAGPSDLLTMGDQGDAVNVAESFISLLGSVPSRQVGADLKKASPVTYIAPDDPPFLILDSNNDEIVYPQQSQELAWDLGVAGVPHELMTVFDGGHAFDTVGEVPSEATVIVAVVGFFVRTLVQHQPLNQGA